MIYILFMAIHYLAIFHPKYQRYGLYLSLFFIGFVIVFRGSVGTDTYMYEHMIAEHISGNIFEGWEPAFKLLIDILGMMSNDELFIVRFVSFLYISILFYCVVKADSLLLFFIAYYFIPAYVFGHGMNVLRLGLGCSIMLLALNMAAIRQAWIMVISCLFQYSLLMVMFFNLGLQIDPLRLKRWLFPLGLAILSTVLVVATNYEYLSAKFNLYSDSAIDEGLSGAGKLITIVLIFFGAVMSSLGKSFRMKFAILYFLFAALGWYVAQFSYAGLRLLDVCSFAAPVALILQHRREGLALNLASKIFIILAGVVSFFSAVRGYYMSMGQGESPFLPYHLIFAV